MIEMEFESLFYQVLKHQVYISNIKEHLNDVLKWNLKVCFYSF